MSLPIELDIDCFLFLFFTGYHFGGMGRHHVLCYGCPFLLQFYIFYIAYYSKYIFSQ